MTPGLNDVEESIFNSDTGVTEEDVIDLINTSIYHSDSKTDDFSINRVDYASQATGAFIVAGMTTNSHLKQVNTTLFEFLNLFLHV